MILYHGTPAPEFARFRADRATYFFVDESEAEALAAAHGGRVLQVEFNGRVVTEAQALRVWNTYNDPCPGYLYSMLCRVTNEFTPSEINRFTRKLTERGYAAVRHWDYSQKNMDDSAEAVCVLDASGLKITRA